MSLDGVVYVVRLFELMLNDIDIDQTQSVVWPDSIDGQSLSPIDGVLVLYDITMEASIDGIPDVLCKSGSNPRCHGILVHLSYPRALIPVPSLLLLPGFLANQRLLAALAQSGPPVLLVSCKEDSPPKLRQVDLDFSQRMKGRFSMLETCSTSANVPESHKRCISVLLRSILTYRKGEQVYSPRRTLHISFYITIICQSSPALSRISCRRGISMSPFTRAGSFIPETKLLFVYSNWLLLM
jgi:hypothetical protein